MSWSAPAPALWFALIHLAISGCTLGILVLRRRLGVGLLWLWIGALTVLMWVSFGAGWRMVTPSLGSGGGTQLYLGSGLIAPSLLMLLLLVYLEHGAPDARRVLGGIAFSGVLFQLFHELARLGGGSVIPAPGWRAMVAGPAALACAGIIMMVVIQALARLQVTLWLRCFVALTLGIVVDALLFPVLRFAGSSAFRSLHPHPDLLFSKALAAVILTLPAAVYVGRQTRGGRRLAMQDMGPLAIAGLGNEGPVPSFEMWRAMADTVGDGMTAMVDGHVVFANAAMARIAGYPGADRMAGLSLATLAAPEDLESVRAEYGAVQGGGTTSASFEWRLVRPDGQVRVLATTATTALLGSGRVALAIHRDVTEERRTRAELVASNRAVRALMAGASSLVASLRPDVLIASVAEQARTLVRAEFVVFFERLTGSDLLVCRHTEGPAYGILTGEEVTRDHALRFGLLPRSGARHALPLLAGGRELGLLVIALREEGREFTADELALLDALGAMASAVLNTSRLVEQLTDAERRYATLFDQVPAAIWLYDPETLRIEAVNAAAIRRYGWTREEFLSRTLDQLAAEPFRDLAATGAHRLGNASSPPLLLKHQDREGTVFDVLMNLAPVDIAGVPHGLAASVDLTLERRNQERREINQRLESLGRLAGGIAHDFNNILTALQVDLDLLIAEHGHDRGLQADLSHIRHAVERASDLTRQILLFSRNEDARRKPINLNDSIRSIERLLHRSLGELVELEVQLTQDPPTISADAAQLQLAVVNLCINARDAMPRGGRVTVSTECLALDPETAERLGMPAGPAVRLTVEDNGTGMAPEVRARALEPFFTTKAERGTGLGLSIVHGVVTGHGGAVELDSEPGLGTRVTLTLPLLAQDAAAPEAAPPPDLRGDACVLLVDDEPAVRRAGRRMLQRYGYRVVEAEHGLEALDRLMAPDQAIDVVITDMVMPRMDATGLLAEVRRRWPGLPVILSTGYDDGRLSPGDIERYQGVIPKPYTAQELLTTLREVLHAAGAQGPAQRTVA